jgi:hypothetical protein
VTDEELIERLSLLVLDVRELVAERDQLRVHDREGTNLTIDQQVEIGRLATENQRLRAALNEYRSRHPCLHAVRCWSDERAQALDREPTG